VARAAPAICLAAEPRHVFVTSCRCWIRLPPVDHARKMGGLAAQSRTTRAIPISAGPLTLTQRESKFELVKG